MPGLAMLSLLTLRWSERAPLPHPEAGGAVGWLQGKLVVAGGTAWSGGEKQWLSAVQVFEPRAAVWHAGPSLPRGMGYGASVVSKEGLELLGGMDGRAVIHESWLLASPEGQWRRTGKVPADTLLGRAALVGEAIYLFGGCPDAADLTRCSDAVWQRANGAWQHVSRLPNGPAAMMAVAVVGKSVYLFGGCSSRTVSAVRNHAEAFRFDTSTATWTSMPALPQGVRGAAAVAVGESIYLLGGYTDRGFSRDVLVFHPSSKQYQAATPLPVPLLGIEFVQAGRELLGVGGEAKPRSRSGRVFAAALDGLVP